MKKRIIWLLSIATFMVGCTPSFPAIKSFYVSKFELTEDEKKFYTPLSLSPDGKTIVVDGMYLTDLISGEREDLHQRFETGKNITLKNHDILDNTAFWSFDGRYLGISAKHYEHSRDPVSEAYYVFDMQNNTSKRYDIWASYFSPFNSYQVYSDKGVYNLKDGTIIPFSSDFDFSQEKEFGATEYGVLWSKSLGIPVAQLQTVPYEAPDNVDAEVAIESYYPDNPRNPTYSIPTGIKFSPPRNRSRILLDPTGEYVLVLEWQCSKSQTPCSVLPLNADSVYDTILTLVRWRTKEQKELIRLSAIDPKNVVAYGYVAWSADGSTIFISRLNALPVVLKVR